MSETTARDIASTQSAQAPPRVEENQAVSFLVPFGAVKHLLVGYPSPRRPNRNRPVCPPDPQLREELEAWEAASDEALEGLENGLPE